MTPRRGLRTAIAVAVATGALGVAAAPAAALPIRVIQVKPVEGASAVHLFAGVFAPPSIDACGAEYAVRITNLDSVVMKQWTGRLNVCRFNNGGFTFGVIFRRLDVSAWPQGDYLVCVGARGYVNNGRPSVHAICRIRRF